MKEIVRHMIEGNTYQALELFEVDHGMFYCLLKLKRSKGELNVSHESVSTSLEEALPHIDQRHPLSFVLNTSRVLKKLISKEMDGSPAQRVSHAFPNLKLDSFFYEIMEYDGAGIVSMCRKSELDEAFETLLSHGIQPCMVSLGISSIKYGIPHLNWPVQGSNFRVQLKGSEGLQLEIRDTMEQNRIAIDGLELSNIGLLAFSAILGYISKRGSTSNLADINGKLANAFKNRRFFRLGLQSGLGTVLLLLLTNFFLFSQFQERTQELGSPQDLQIQKDMLEEVRNRVYEKEAKLKTVLGSSNSKASYYLDRIAHGLPHSILLDEMIYQPILKPVQDGKPIDVVNLNMEITGETGNKEAFTQWTDSLKKMEWIKIVDILGYEYASPSLDRFSLKIELYETGQ